MRHRLVEMLVCPECSASLRLKTLATSRNDFDESSAPPECRRFCSYHDRDVTDQAETSPACDGCYSLEIDQGTLTCVECQEWFPIIDGIPRLLPRSLRQEMLETYHSQWMRRYSPRQDNGVGDQRRSTRGDLMIRTIASFSFQWNAFSAVLPHWESNFRDYLGALADPRDFEGKSVLDVGCGFGRHLMISAGYGAEAIGIDLSEAVVAAYRNTRQWPGVHVVQADLYNLPIRKVVDLIYCIGVIQHLPEPKAGFLALAESLKPGAAVFVWVYGRRRGLYRLVDWIRPLTVRLPSKVLYPLVFILAGLSHALFVYPRRLLRKLPPTRALAEKIPFSSYADYPFQVSCADWFDRLSVPSTVYFGREEVEDWFQSGDLEEVQIVSRRPSGWRGIGVRR